jgi:hypothetical protein
MQRRAIFADAGARMSSFPGSPKLVKGGLVVLDAATGAAKRTIALQYNPDSLTRSFLRNQCQSRILSVQTVCKGLS